MDESKPRSAPGPDAAASSSPRDRRGHFRGKPRPGRRVPVTFQIEEGGRLGSSVRTHTKNIGVGGAFILTPTPPPPGTPIQLSLALPQPSQIVEVRAEVRWIVDETHTAQAHDHGMGVKFAPLDVEQLLALNEYFASLAGTELVEHDES